MPTLNWIGKEAVVNHHRQVPYHLLRCDEKLSVGVRPEGQGRGHVLHSWPEIRPKRNKRSAAQKKEPSLQSESRPLRGELTRLRGEFEALRGELPEELRSALGALTQRTSPDRLNELLIRLCQWKPLGIAELAALTGKSQKHLRDRNLRRLLADRRIRYLHANEPHHPPQKYVAGKGA